MFNLAINTIGNELKISAEFCKSEGLGIEITDFAFPRNLEGDLTSRIDKHLKALSGLSKITSHGPFYDLIASSPDPAIIEVCQKRHNAAFEASKQIGATHYIAHTQYTPLINDPSFFKGWLKRSLDFWLPFADEAGKYGITVCLENLWEASPDIQRELIEQGNHPYLKAIMDTGHSLVFSDVSADKWVRNLGSSLVYYHLHDNYGVYDEHNSIGDGKENWVDLLEAVKNYTPDAILVMDFPRKNGQVVKNVLSSSQIEPDFCILSSNDDGYGYKTIQYTQIFSVSHPFL